MEFEHVFKVVVGAVVSLAIAGFASMTKDVTANRVKIDGLQHSIQRTEKWWMIFTGILFEGKKSNAFNIDRNC